MFSAIFIYLSMLLLCLVSTLPVYSHTKLDIPKKIDTIFFGIVLIITVSFVFGLRYDVGTDYKAYEAMYYDNSSIQDRNTSLEFLYAVFSNFFICLGLPYWCFTIFIEILRFILFFIFIRRKDFQKINLKLLYFFYFTTSFLFLALNIQRHAIAVILFFFSTRYIINRKIVKFLLWIFLAAGFHYSIILMIPFYFVYNIYKKLPQTKYLFMFIVFVLSFIFAKQFSSFFLYIASGLMSFTPYKHYGSLIETWNIETSHGFGVIVRFCMTVLVFFYHKKINKKFNHIFDFLFFMSFIGNFLSNFFSDNILLIRLIFPFISLNIFLWSILFQFFYEEKSNLLLRLFFYSGVFLFIIYFVGQILSSNSNCSPWHFVFNKN